MRTVRTRHYMMADYLKIGDTAGAAPFVIATTGAGVAHSAGPSYYGLGVTATNEAQNLGIHQDPNVLDIPNVILVEWQVKLAWSGNFPSSANVFIGMANGQNDDPSALTEYGGWLANGSTAMTVQTKTAATGVRSASAFSIRNGAFTRFQMHLREKTVSVSPPGQSTAAPSNVVMRQEDQHGELNNIGHGVQFDLSTVTAWRFLVQIGKSASTDVLDCHVRELVLTDRD